MTDLDITVFVAPAADSLSWIEASFPMPIPYNGTVCRQVPGSGSIRPVVSALDANMSDIVSSLLY